MAAGSAKITGQGSSAVTINQLSNIAIINWQSFSINSGESTTFLQPGANSAALNRVLGGQTSLINGTLSANGQVYLINGNGVIVGPGGVIDASAFTASTRNITDADFLSGNLHFTGASDAGVQNLGTINALGGNVVLIGRTADNEGTITAPNGTAGLVAGDDVLLAQKNADGSTITVSPTSTTANAGSRVGVKNGGAITAAAAELKAANGNIYALAVQNEGTIRATTVSHQGGHIWLTSDSGTVSNSGKLDASATAPGGKGGSVTLKSATGTASHTGRIIAQGGDGGTGGNAEISGANVQFTGSVDLTAPGGAKGTLLIDPATIDIVNGGGSALTGSTIDPSAIVSALETTDVTLTASTSVTVDSLIDASGNSNPGNLTFDTPVLNLNAGVALNGSFSSTASTVNIGPSGLVQNGIDAVASGGTVNLSAGATYPLTSEVVINKSLDLEGNGATFNGQNVTRDMEIDGGNVILDALTFVGGNGVSSLGVAGSTWNNDGGAMLVYGQNTTTQVSITNSTFINNNCSSGGAIYNVSISGGGNAVFLEDDTLFGNSATLGSAVYLYGAFGGSASLAMKEDTIASNSGTGAIYSTVLSSGGSSVIINDSILACNTVNGAESDYVNSGGGTLTDIGYNLYGQNGDGGGFPSTAGTDILLAGPLGSAFGPLGDYGGPTPTLPLIAGSPALESGDPGFAGAPDQRGILRGSAADFTGPSTDIGAYEAQYVSIQADSQSIVYGETPTLTYTVTGGPAAAIASLSGSPALSEPATNVGVYGEDIGQGTLAANPQYIVDFTNGDLTITPATLVYVADPVSVPVGAAFPVFTGSVTGFVGGDTVANATTGNLIFSSPASPSAPAGTYPIDGGGLIANNGNYTFVQSDTNANALTLGTPSSVMRVATVTSVADSVSEPDTPVSQAAAQTSSSATPVPTGALPGGSDTPALPSVPLAVDITMNSISPNESIDESTPSTPAGSSSSGSTDTGSIAQGSSFTPGTADNTSVVAVGQTVTLGGRSGGAPPPPAVEAELTQVLGAGSLDSLSSALSSVSMADDSGSPAAGASSSAGASDQTASSAGGSSSRSSSSTAAAGSATAGGSSNSSAPGQAAPATVVAPGQTIVLGHGAAASGPPPPTVQAQFNEGFSPESRASLSQAAGL